MTVFQTLAIILTFAASGSYLNKRFMHLPTSVGMMLFALLLSLSAMLAERLSLLDMNPATALISDIDFSGLFLHGMLSFLLFAGALHVDLHELKKYRVIVALLATVGVVIATAVTGSLVWLMSQGLGLQISLLNSFLFGALISPTDPVAVLGILKDSPIAKGLRLKISSESLLNDGVGVVLFLFLLAVASSPNPMAEFSWNNVVLIAAWEGLGSIALGLALGGIAYLLLRGIDDYKTEILFTLALAAGGYSFAEAIHVSAPITMVVAGLVVGNHGRAFVMSDKTRKHLDMFWELLDDILNTVLFLLIGLQIMAMPITPVMLALGLAAILATLAGRFVSVSIPIRLLHFRVRFEKGAVRLMTWGGLRGGISIAMALSLPTSPTKATILSMTYLTVAFSVLFQGTTFSHVVKRVMRPKRV